MYEIVPENRIEFGKIIGESFTIFWRHRSLWVASIIAGLLGQGRVNGSFNYTQGQPFPQGAPGEVPQMPDFGQMIQGTIIEDFLNNPLPYLLILGAIWLIWGLITLIFGSWAAGALICMVDEIDHQGATSVRSGWRLARSRLAALIGLRLLILLPSLIMLVLLAVALVPFLLQMLPIFSLPPEQMEAAMQKINPEIFSGMFCLFPLAFCVFLPLTIGLAAISVFAERACMLEQTGVMASLRRGWQILRSQIGYSILAWVITIVFGMIMSVLMIVPIIPFMGSIFGTFLSQGVSSEMVSTFTLLGIYLVLVSLTIGSFFAGWTSVFWTRLYKAFGNRL